MRIPRLVLVVVVALAGVPAAAQIVIPILECVQYDPDTDVLSMW
ncbi:MAG: hypothetical protein ACXW5U_17640 [Thermoanaerobaculia bacterium]